MKMVSRESRSTAKRRIANSRKVQNRERLAKATENYFKSLSPEAAAEENAIAQSLTPAIRGLDFSRDV